MKPISLRITSRENWDSLFSEDARIGMVIDNLKHNGNFWGFDVEILDEKEVDLEPESDV